MDVSLDDDQQLLVATATGMAADIGCLPPHELPSTDDDAAGWELLADAGLLGLHVPVEAGGSGAHAADVALVVEQLAAPCCRVPFVGQGVLAPELLALAGASDELLTGVAAGSRRITVALTDDLGALGRLGAPAVAWDALGATHAVLLDGTGAPHLVELGGPAMEQVDLSRTLVALPGDAPAEAVGSPIAHRALARYQALALAVLSADLLGVMGAALDAAVEHVAVRTQFGVPVGTFQAVQHMAADAKVALEATRSAVWAAAWGADELEPTEALLGAHQAKAFASRAGLEVVEIQTQMLGGIAITWEEQAHVRLRRALLDRLTLGDESAHEDALATLLLGTPG